MTVAVRQSIKRAMASQQGGPCQCATCLEQRSRVAREATERRVENEHKAAARLMDSERHVAEMHRRTAESIVKTRALVREIFQGMTK